MTYKVSQAPLTDDVRQVVEWAHRELTAAARAISQVHDMQVFHVEPAKVKIGLVRYADGTDWNPGGGAGLYEYTGAGTNGWRQLANGTQY